MISDPARIPFYILASTVSLAVVIWVAGGAHVSRWPKPVFALVVAFVISAVGIVFAKYGANFGLPWWIYYTAPMLATILVPPLLFRLSLWRAALYVVMAFATAPLIHAAFYYGLGWGDYMPFLRLPDLQAR